MYYNIVKRNTKTNEFVNIVKTYDISKFHNLAYAKIKANDYVKFRNILSRILNKYYYKVELDFE